MPTVTEELASLRTMLSAITGDLDAMIKNAEPEPEPEPVEETWHAC